MEPDLQRTEPSAQSKATDGAASPNDSPVAKQSSKDTKPPGGLHHKSKRQDKAPYARRKIPPTRPSQAINDIYINRKTDFSAQLARSHKLLDQGCTELNIHGLGAAIHRAINLALQIRETSSVPMEISATTATVELQDELEPLDDDGDYSIESRSCSAVHIRLFQTPPPRAAKSAEKTVP